MLHQSTESIEVFFSYSHKDEGLRDELSKHLSILKRQKVISDWHDRQITAGDEWKGVIDERLDSAHVILLLISSDFLSSDYCYDIELKRALERHDKEEAIVVPIILRDCDWNGAPFEKLQALPKDSKPVDSWENRDEAFTNVARGIREVVEKLTTATPPQKQPQQSTPQGPHLGSLVTRLCDRMDQQTDFSRFFRTQSKDYPGWPQIYLICGEERECPESLVKRLTRTVIQKFAHDKWGEQRGVVTEKMVLWPEDGEEVERRDRLMETIFSEFDHDCGDLSASSFTRAFSSMIDPVIVLRHNYVRAERWEKLEKSLLRWYLQFWDEVGNQAPKPQFVVFLSILYPYKDSASGWMSLFKRSRFDRVQMKGKLDELLENRSRPPNCPSRMLKELSCIERHHVKQWFDQHDLFDEAVRLTKCDELFRDSACRHMAEIQEALRQSHQEFINQRGY
jgi:hypothetical protein